MFPVRSLTPQQAKGHALAAGFDNMPMGNCAKFNPEITSFQSERKALRNFLCQ